MTARARARAAAAFTLLEVMMAIAILAMCLTAIFSSEGGSVRMAARSRRIGVATLLARCKMGEIEEQVATEGLPALFDSGSDECCEDGEVDGYECKWEIVPIVLPETMFAPEEGAAGSGAGGGSAGVLDQLAAGKDQMGSVDPSAMLAGGGTEGLASMALGFVFPILKPAFEQQIRRATVIVQWKEGSSAHEFDVTQYMVSPTAITLPTEGETGEDPAAAALKGLTQGAGSGTRTPLNQGAAP